MVMGSGVLPDREKIPRGIGASIPSKKSGDSIGVSGPARKWILGDPADGGVEAVPRLRRSGEPVVGMNPGVKGV